MTFQISYDHAVKLQCCNKIGKSEKIILFGTLWAIDLYMLSPALCTPKIDTYPESQAVGQSQEAQKLNALGLFIILLQY